VDNRGCQRLLVGELPDAAHDLLRPSDNGRVEAAAGGYRDPPRDVTPRRERHCPECGALLLASTTDPKHFGATVELDVCPAHGTWFDRGEAWVLFQTGALRRAAVDYDVSTLLRGSDEERWEAFVFRLATATGR
jgi:Zn-finger nucleic acid-binding protein